MNVLVLGGSGFLSGAVVRCAVAAGNRVWVVTRGRRPIPDGAVALVADRHDAGAFADAVARIGSPVDLVIDCIAFTPTDAEQDVDVFGPMHARLVLVSTDFVYDPACRRYPQTEDDADYLVDAYGGLKRQAERVLLGAGVDALRWSVVRPGHIYGPGSLLGCLPPGGRDADLIDKIESGSRIPLVGGGRFLQQPVYVDDLARVIIDVGSTDATVGGIYNVAGPDTVESVEYYRIVATAIGKELLVDEVPVDADLAANPDRASFLCHRFYSLEKLVAAGVKPPDTPLATGLRLHVESLRSS